MICKTHNVKGTYKISWIDFFIQELLTGLQKIGCFLFICIAVLMPAVGVTFCCDADPKIKTYGIVILGFLVLVFIFILLKNITKIRAQFKVLFSNFNSTKKSHDFEKEPESFDPEKESEQNYIPPPFPSAPNLEKEYAELLGLKGIITKKEIKAKYRELAAKNHPDKVNHLDFHFVELANKRMQSINAAYQYFKFKYNIV